MEQNQQSNDRDTQAVIAAMRLLMRHLHSAEQKMVLSSLMRENEYLQVEDDLKYHIDDATEIVQPKYPIEPLILDSEESNKSAEYLSSTGYAASEGETPYEAPFEGRYREKVLTTYASFLLPLTASFTRRRWWGYLIVSSLFLLTLSVSSLFSYRAGLTASKPAAVALPVTCMQSIITVSPVKEKVLQRPGQATAIAVLVSGQPGQGTAGFVYWRHGMWINGTSYVLNTEYRENFQCFPVAVRVLPHP